MNYILFCHIEALNDLNYSYFYYLFVKKYYLFLQKNNKDTNNLSPLMLLYDKIKENSVNDNNLGQILVILNSVTKKLKVGYLKSIAKYLIKHYSTEVFNENINLKNKKKIFSNKNSAVKIIYIFNFLINEGKIDINSDIDNKGNNIFFLSAIKNSFYQNL
jgi:hypothetical protein